MLGSTPTSLRKPGRVGLPPARCRRAARRRRRGVRAQRAPHGRLLRAARRDRRARSTRTAGTTPATSARSTTRATSRSSGGPATCMRTGGETVAPAEVEAVARRPTPRSPRSRSSASPTRSGARSCARWSCPCRARARPRRSTRCAPTATGRLAGVQAAPPGRARRRSSPAPPATGQIQRTLLVERIGSTGRVRNLTLASGSETTVAIGAPAWRVAASGGSACRRRALVRGSSVSPPSRSSLRRSTAVSGVQAKPDFSKLKTIKEPERLQERPRRHRRHHQGRRHHVRRRARRARRSRRPTTGIQARIDEANENGELGDRRSSSSWPTTQANQARNLTAAQQLVEEEKVFGIIEQSNVADGSAQYLNEREDPGRGLAHRSEGVGHLPQHVRRGGTPSRLTRRSTFTSRNADVMKELGREEDRRSSAPTSRRARSSWTRSRRRSRRPRA